MDRSQQNRLVKQCLRQDRLAQRFLYEQYKDAMFTVAVRITNDRDLAHDALQEAFVNVFVHLQKFRGSGTLGSWIKTIVVRAALKEVAGLHLHANIEEEADAHEVRFDEGLTGPLLHQLIGQLPDKSRVVFALIEIEGYGHKEVAKMLNVSVGTTKSQLHYAKSILKQKLLKHGYEAQKKG